MPTMIYACVENTLVVAHDNASPSDEEWADWLIRMGKHDYNCILISTRGGAPSAKQRKQTNDFWGAKLKPKMAVLSDSAAVRGALFAFYWLFKGAMMPFASDHPDAALAFLDVPVQSRRAVIDAMSKLHQQLDIAARSRRRVG